MIKKEIGRLMSKIEQKEGATITNEDFPVKITIILGAGEADVEVEWGYVEINGLLGTKEFDTCIESLSIVVVEDLKNQLKNIDKTLKVIEEDKNKIEEWLKNAEF